jgi:hypothetical protein
LGTRNGDGSPGLGGSTHLKRVKQPGGGGRDLLDGLVKGGRVAGARKPLIFRTYWSAAARMSASVTASA